MSAATLGAVAGSDAGTPPPSRVAVLLVDDNAGKRLALRALLSPLGHDIIEADSGVAALRCVAATDFAVILLDVRMPIMDGFETAALIRQRRQCEMTPIIFITAGGRDEMTSDKLAEGAVDFITAPVPPDELRAKVTVFANLFLRAEALAAAAREVQASADQLRLLTDAAPIGIFQTDADNRYVYTNPRWTEITGVPADVAVGAAWDSIIGTAHRAVVRREVLDGAHTGDEHSRRFEIRPEGPDPRIVLVTSRPVPTIDGGTAGWVGTLADVTAEAGAEAAMSHARDEATEASQLKSDFLANMSHEIRTPMNGVLGMTDLLLETDLDTRQRDFAQTVRNSGEALLIIINDILDFSKVEAGKLDVECIDFDLRTIVEGVIDLLAGSALGKGLELIATLPSSLPEVITGDPGRVRQVLTNLLGNAIKFTAAGEVEVRVEANEGDDGRTVVRFCVTDTGDGIAPDALTSVFKPFVQADSSTTRRYGGTGLGLAISAQLVTLMGGTCGVTSQVGVGSQFWFTVHTPAEDGAPAGRPTGTDPDLAGVDALVATTNTTQRQMISGHLAEWGMGVTAVGSEPDALSALRAAAAEGHPIAVAVVDLPSTGGSATELRQAVVDDPSLDVRVVLVTALGEERPADGAPVAVSATVSKPVHRAHLRTALRAALAPATADPAPDRPRTTAPPPSRRSQVGRLLLAEDNVINQKVAVAMLANAGYEVDVAVDGAAAVAAMGDRQYDAILMDCQMPELNGYEATAAIRALEGADRHTPIIAMTAGARAEDRERCLAEGMDSYLAKPFSKDTLLSEVARTLRSGAAGGDRGRWRRTDARPR